MRPPRTVAPHTDDRDTGINEDHLDEFSNDQLRDACIDLVGTHESEAKIRATQA